MNKIAFQFGEIDRRRIELVVGGYCRAHKPRSAEPYVRLYYRIRANTVVLAEDRRHYLDEAHWVTVPIARLVFDAQSHAWSLQWRRASGRWSPYPTWKPSASLDLPMQEIDRDPERLFWS